MRAAVVLWCGLLLTSFHTGALQEIGSLAFGRLGQRRLEQLSDNTEHEVALELVRARTKHAHALVSGRGSRCREQSRLADAGGPLDHDEPAASGASLRKRRFDTSELFVPLEQNGTLKGRKQQASQRR